MALGLSQWMSSVESVEEKVFNKIHNPQVPTEDLFFIAYFHSLL